MRFRWGCMSGEEQRPVSKRKRCPYPLYPSWEDPDSPDPVLRGSRVLKNGSRVHIYQCRVCGRRYSERTDSIYARTRYPPELIEDVRHRLSSGQSVRSVAADIGVSPSTVQRWKRRVSPIEAELNSRLCFLGDGRYLLSPAGSVSTTSDHQDSEKESEDDSRFDT